MSDEQEPRTLRFESESIDAEALRGALLRREREGGSLALSLVFEGLIGSADLARFMAKRTSLDCVSDELWENASSELFPLVPAELRYDGPVLPLALDAASHSVVVALADPLDVELLKYVELFAGRPLHKVVAAIDDIARHYPRLAGQTWRVRPEELVAQPCSSEEAARVLAQAHAIECALIEGSEGKETSFLIEVVGRGDTETLTLSRARRTAAATLDRADQPSLTEAERPRIRGKARGEARHYLEPVEEGEALLVERTRPQAEAGPSIIVDPSLLEPQDSDPDDSPASSRDSSIIIDPSLLSSPEKSDEAAQHARRAVEVRLGRASGAYTVVDPDDEWAALGSQLDVLDDALADFDWPFELGEDDAGEPAQAAAPTTVPGAGETNLEGSRSAVPTLSWFNPFTEPDSRLGVNNELREALREMRIAETRRSTFVPMANMIAAVYERAAVLRVVADRAYVTSYAGPRTGGRWVDNDESVLTMSAMPALLELLDEDSTSCYHGRLPRQASESLRTALPGGPALSTVICPIRCDAHVIMLLCADSGPGRDSARYPELWRLLWREVPVVLRRMALSRKRLYRWQVK